MIIYLKHIIFNIFLYFIVTLLFLHITQIVSYKFWKSHIKYLRSPISKSIKINPDYYTVEIRNYILCNYIHYNLQLIIYPKISYI